jgi:hypothetical protein
MRKLLLACMVVGLASKVSAQAPVLVPLGSCALTSVGVYIATDQTDMTGTGGAGTYRLAGTVPTTVGSESMTTAGVPPFATYAAIYAYSQSVNWRDDGTAPTATPGTGGNQLTATSSVPGALPYSAGYPAKGLTMIQFIQQTPTATVGIAFYQGASPQ